MIALYTKTLIPHFIMGEFVKNGRVFHITVNNNNLKIYSNQLDSECNLIHSTYRKSELKLYSYSMHVKEFYKMIDQIVYTHLSADSINDRFSKDNYTSSRDILYNNENVKKYSDIGGRQIQDLIESNVMMHVVVGGEYELTVNVKKYDTATEEYIYSITVPKLSNILKVELREKNFLRIEDANKLYLLYRAIELTHLGDDGFFSNKLTNMLWNFINKKCEYNPTYDRVTGYTLLCDFLAKTDELFDKSITRGDIY